MDDNINIYYMKFDRYIAEIEIYCDSNKHNHKSCIPVCYRILNFTDIVNQTESEHIYLDENSHTCLIENEHNDFTITRHIKILSKNMVIFYKNLCEFSNKIIKNILLDNNNRIEIFITDKLQKAYIDRDMAFYENFMEKQQYLYYPDGYAGIYKKYNFMYDENGFLEEEYFHINGIIQGIKKIYCHHSTCGISGLIMEQNYVEGKIYGTTKCYKHLCWKRKDKDNKYNRILTYVTESAYKCDIYDDSNNLIETKYYSNEINVTWFVNIFKKINFFY